MQATRPAPPLVRRAPAHRDDVLLPLQVESNYIGDKFRHPSTLSMGRLVVRLTSSARPLGVLALFAFAVFALLNAPALLTWPMTLCGQRTRESSDVLLDRFAETASEHLRPAEWRDLSTLVLVAGHAIFTGQSWGRESLTDERNWILEKFQTGQVATFLKHIQKGVEIAANDSSSLLIFSGGQTRGGAGPRSEGLTYWMAAESSSWYGHDPVRNRSLAEEYARDSLENLLFSVCRFHQVVGRYPRLIKVVSFGFKRIRFTDIHRKALRFPAHRFEFYGIDPDGTDGMRGLTAGERARAMGPFAGDPYGCHTSVLSEKKEIRNPYLRYHPYPQGCPDLAPLFRHCGRSVYGGPLPWDPRVYPRNEDRHR